MSKTPDNKPKAADAEAAAPKEVKKEAAPTVPKEYAPAVNALSAAGFGGLEILGLVMKYGPGLLALVKKIIAERNAGASAAPSEAESLAIAMQQVGKAPQAPEQPD